MRRISIVDHCEDAHPGRKDSPHPAPEMFAIFAIFANFDGFKPFIRWQEERAGLLDPSFRRVPPPPPLGQNDAVWGARAAGCMPGGEELARDLRGHEPEPLTGMRDLTRF